MKILSKLVLPLVFIGNVTLTQCFGMAKNIYPNLSTTQQSFNYDTVENALNTGNNYFICEDVLSPNGSIPAILEGTVISSLTSDNNKIHISSGIYYEKQKEELNEKQKEELDEKFDPKHVIALLFVGFEFNDIIKNENSKRKDNIAKSLKKLKNKNNGVKLICQNFVGCFNNFFQNLNEFYEPDFESLYEYYLNNKYTGIASALDTNLLGSKNDNEGLSVIMQFNRDNNKVLADFIFGYETIFNTLQSYLSGNLDINNQAGDLLRIKYKDQINDMNWHSGQVLNLIKEVLGNNIADKVNKQYEVINSIYHTTQMTMLLFGKFSANKKVKEIISLANPEDEDFSVVLNCNLLLMKLEEDLKNINQPKQLGKKTKRTNLK